ncbi:hypothetical protein HD806DRAFT_282894 [Xylariaceae sp. AK1471]|nr:hypothetical protein HD806DRAFT_282894 [Xylariaceae sp. AK1471]
MMEAMATTRDASHTPGRDLMQGIETATNGVHVNGVDKGAAYETAVLSHTTSPGSAPSAAPGTPQAVQESIRAVSKTPPQPQPQPLSTQPPAMPTLPTMQPADVQTAAYQVQPLYPQASQSHQHPQASQFTTVPTSGVTSTLLSSQAGQSRRHSQEMNAVPKRFPSPDIDYHTQLPRFNRDLSLLADAVQQSCPEAVRRVVRDKWEKCVMGSEFHHAFIMNAIIHHASGVIMRRAIRDFGQNLVTEAKHEIATHLGPQDIDEIAGAILERCSDQFLDRAMEQRLKTIEARPLINALARAERLGYESSDILEDRKEKVVPAAQMHSPVVNPVTGIQSQHRPPPAAPAFTRSSLPPQEHQTSRHVPPTTELRCRLCWRSFEHTKPYEYHVQKQLCAKAPPDPRGFLFSCDYCGAGFATKAGQQYHQANAVCGLHATATATPKPQTTLKSEFPAGSPMQHPSSQTPSYPRPAAEQHIPPLTQFPPASSQSYSTPVQSNVSSMETPGSSQDDPYRHLNAKRRAELEEELRQAEMSYAPRFKEAEEIADPATRKTKIDSLQNTFSTKQSIIRRKYGVKLRQRRTRAEIEEERSRMGLKHGPSSPGSTAETPSAKRQRSDDGPNFPAQSHTPVPPPTNHLSVLEMKNSGLGGSTATAATADPTISGSSTQPPSAEQQPPQNSLSSLQRKGYRVSSHVGQPSQPASSTPNPQRSGSASVPVLLDDSSDDTDTDEDIPATLPPKKVS